MDDRWYDDAAGPLVRPYTITRGRTPSANDQLDVATQVKTIRSGRDPIGLTPEHLIIMQYCREQAFSVAELAVYVKVPLGVVKVLCGDLIERGDVIVRSPSPLQAPSRELLQAVLDGLSKL
jgi:hypothetical protein